MLTNKCKRAMGSDVSPPSVENTLVNLKKHNLEAKVVVSDVLDGVDKEEIFDVIYWNYPFHIDKGDKDTEEMDDIERGLRDPGYKHLEKLFLTAKAHMPKDGKIYTSFSKVMGNEPELAAKAKQCGWDWKVVDSR